MDAFWFDVNEGYRKWRSDCWPEGPKRWLDACKKRRNKARFVVLYELAAYRWRGKYDESYSGMGKFCGGRQSNSLSVQGGYLHHLMQTLQMYADMVSRCSNLILLILMGNS